jgi:acetyl esterase/lipase
MFIAPALSQEDALPRATDVESERRCRRTCGAETLAAMISSNSKGIRMHKLLLSGALLLSVAAAPAAQTAPGAQTPAWAPPIDRPTILVWPHGAPGAKADGPPEANMTTAKDRVVGGRAVIRLSNVSTPTLTLYSPKEKNTGAAVMVFPGGGYQVLAIDLEGTEVCDWLVSEGITCILLKYRVPDAGPYPVSEAPLQDAQRAMGLVREYAAEWHVDPKRIGVLGFSAGAHLAAALSNLYEKRVYDPIDAADQLSCRPNFAVIVYPGYLALAEKNFEANPEIRPTAQTPPTFIVQAEDDTVHVENAVVYFMALKNAKVPAELHIYAEGGHGYGMRRTELPVTTWPQSVDIWLHTIHVLPAAGR